MHANPLQQNTLLRPFYASLDGLRFVCFLMVFLFHFMLDTGRHGWIWAPTNLGWLGVDIFFVISGFLITGILYDSRHDPVQAPHFFRNFYTRRALRVLPLFYGFWLVMFLCTPVLKIH